MAFASPNGGRSAIQQGAVVTLECQLGAASTSITVNARSIGALGPDDGTNLTFDEIPLGGVGSD
jgi:hypothetical protein